MSERKIKFWLDSGANIHSCRTVYLTLEEMGVDEDTWDNMSDATKEDVAREICFERADWGWSEE